MWRFFFAGMTPTGEGAGGGVLDSGDEGAPVDPAEEPDDGGGGPVGVGLGGRVGSGIGEPDELARPELTTISMARFEASPAPSTTSKRTYRGTVVGEVATS
jgi:hypothetical protein